jgi:hypothetical protein
MVTDGLRPAIGRPRVGDSSRRRWPRHQPRPQSARPQPSHRPSGSRPLRAGLPRGQGPSSLTGFASAPPGPSAASRAMTRYSASWRVALAVPMLPSERYDEAVGADRTVGSRVPLAEPRRRVLLRVWRRWGRLGEIRSRARGGGRRRTGAGCRGRGRGPVVAVDQRAWRGVIDRTGVRR